MVSNLDEKVSWLAAVPLEEMRCIVDALYRVHRLISVLTDLDTLLECIMQESKEVARAEACSLLLYDPRKEDLYFHVALGERGDQQALKRQVRLKLNQGIAGVAAATRKSVNVKDVAKDARFYPAADATSQFETRSLLAVPLVDRVDLIGVLEVVNKVDGDAFTEADRHVLEMFSSIEATAIANARLIEKDLRGERLIAIGEAIAGLSHYTKNIITGMSGSTDLIDQGLETGNIEFLRKSWPIFKRSTHRISNFVEDMLAFSRTGKPVYESCNLHDMIREAADTFWDLLTRKGVALEVNLDGVTGPVYVDGQGLYRCLLNLLVNAAEAVPRTDGKIQIKAWTTEESELHIEVSDNGRGVPEEFIERIFDPFFTTKGTHGTGLGLAVTRKIIDEHGGNITVGCSEAGGALFHIVLPKVLQPE